MVNIFFPIGECQIFTEHFEDINSSFYIEYCTLNSSERTNYVRFSYNKVTIGINNLAIYKNKNFGSLKTFKVFNWWGHWSHLWSFTCVIPQWQFTFLKAFQRYAICGYHSWVNFSLYLRTLKRRQGCLNIHEAHLCS